MVCLWVVSFIWTHSTELWTVDINMAEIGTQSFILTVVTLTPHLLWCSVCWSLKTAVYNLIRLLFSAVVYLYSFSKRYWCDTVPKLSVLIWVYCHFFLPPKIKGRSEHVVLSRWNWLEDSLLLECDTVLVGALFPVFWMIVMTSCLIKQFKEAVWSFKMSGTTQWTQQHSLEEWNLQQQCCKKF
jgi:hypothetical protein